MMVKDLVIFEPDIYDYSDDPRVNVSKPVLYTPEFFKELVDGLDDVKLDIEHKDTIVGSLSNIRFVDNKLICDADTDEPLTGKGISPVFRFDTLDKGKYLEAVNGEFASAGITVNPRTNITYNSNSNDKRSDNMVSEEAFEQISKQNRKLERELATKDNLLEANKSKLERLAELEEENKNLRAENKKFTDELNEIRPVAQKYSDYENQKKESLLDEITKGDTGLREQIKDWGVEQLEVLNSNRTVTTEPTGIASQGAEGQGEVETTTEEETTPNSEEFVEFYENKFGEKPNFIKGGE